MGDGVQAAKAGILEIGDIFVVNKSDRDGAQALIRELRGMVALGERAPDAWKPPIVATVASRGEGIDELLDRIEQFRAAQQAQRGLDRHAGSPGPAGRSRVWSWPGCRPSSPSTRRAGLDDLAEAVSRGELDAYTAADQLRSGRRLTIGSAGMSASAWRSSGRAGVR